MGPERCAGCVQLAGCIHLTPQRTPHAPLGQARRGQSHGCCQPWQWRGAPGSRPLAARSPAEGMHVCRAALPQHAACMFVAQHCLSMPHACVSHSTATACRAPGLHPRSRPTALHTQCMLQPVPSAGPPHTPTGTLHTLHIRPDMHGMWHAVGLERGRAVLRAHGGLGTRHLHRTLNGCPLPALLCLSCQAQASTRECSDNLPCQRWAVASAAASSLWACSGRA